MPGQQSFSEDLQAWLERPGKKTFGSLESVFHEKSFAVAFLILMAPAALPLPTGGLTHILELITILLALEMIFGRTNIWLPKAWLQHNLGKGLEKTALPKLVKFIKWFEVRSKKRLSSLPAQKWYLRLVGFLVFIFALAALLAVPFSGLDTLPALAVIIISLALILEDVLWLIIAFMTGLSGIILEISLGAAAWHYIIH